MDHGVDANNGAKYGSSGSWADYGDEVEVYDSAGKMWGVGKTFMDQFNEDEYAAEREQNQYFPLLANWTGRWHHIFFGPILARPISTSTSISNL